VGYIPAMQGLDSGLAPILGREEDLAHLTSLLREHRLVTITAPGGSGKTRLAQEVGSRATGSGARATFVDVTGIDDAEWLPSTVLAALGEAGSANDPMADIAERIRESHHLLILDNLEQVRNAGTAVAALLEAASQATVLATSRTPLRAPGEVEFPLSPLALPQRAADLMTTASSQLFVARAHAVSRMPITDESAAAIVELCRRLDGLPLAIELAAARTRILSPSEILDRLDTRGLSAIEPADRDERRSIAAIVAWTVSLLDAPTRRALHAASACEGFDLDLLEAIIPADDAAGAVEQLVALGLVRVISWGGGRTRYAVLETIRQALLQAMDPDDRDAWRLAHARTMVSRADAAWSKADGGSLSALKEMEADIDNYRRSMTVLESVDPDGALLEWRRLQSVWVNGRLGEATARFDRLASFADRDSRELARGMSNMAGYVALVHGQSAAAPIHERMLDVARRAGDTVSIAAALTLLATNALSKGDTTEAGRIADELERLDVGDDPAAALYAGEGRAMTLLAIDGPLGTRALHAYQELVSLARAQQRLEMAMTWSGNVAFLHLCREEWQEAERAGLEAWSLAQNLNRTYYPIFAGYVAIAQAYLGRLDDAARILVEAVDPDALAASAMPIADVLRAAAVIAALRGKTVTAARLAGAASVFWAAEGDDLDAGERLLADRTLELVRRRARALDVELALRDGAESDPLMLLPSLSDLLTAEQTSAVKDAGGPLLRHGELTRREIEILSLVGQGKSDPEIAEDLFISPKTASVHVAHIKEKLGVDSRLAIALRARDLGLV
jgi:predicted ATPase/DNA-binding CsgD family transcriptional regulator